MPRRFFTLDVFTSSPLAGNPLAVVLDGHGLGDAGMQAIAREFNLSETVFVLPPADPRQRARLRIFTPARELPFAGHPTVGTAVLLGLIDHGPRHGTLAFGLEENVGLVPCAVEVEGEGRGNAVFTLPKLPARLGELGSNAAIAAALDVAVSDIGFDNHAPARYSAGVPYAHVPLGSRAAVDKARARLSHWAEAFGTDNPPATLLYCREPVLASDAFYARMFAPGMGINEDPATGSAVASFAGAIMDFDRPVDGEHLLVVEQGYAMGRPSRIQLTLSVADGKLAKAAIGGEAVVVSEGALFLVSPRIVPLSRINARIEAASAEPRWPWAHDNRAMIEAHWHRLTAAKPALYNGRVLMLRHKRIVAGTLTARYFETDYASFITWHDLGHPDQSVGNGFAMAALRSADGAWLLGIMGEHTANAGRIYFPAGTPDPSDLTAAGEVDLAGSVMRELEEETGLTAADVTLAERWTCVIDEPRTALMREARAHLDAAALQARIHAWLARQRRPELTAMHVVRSPRDFDEARMPPFTLAFLRHVFDMGASSE